VVRHEIVNVIWDRLAPEIEEQGYELVEVEYGQHGGTYILRLFIDREGGVTLDDCVGLSPYVGALLDKDGLVSDKYMLEVSSPGIERPVRKAKDFERFEGESIKIQTISPIQGRKRFNGRLKGFQDGLILVEIDDAVHEIHIENVNKAHLVR
jgi:ribosome maturation factor RimP